MTDMHTTAAELTAGQVHTLLGFALTCQQEMVGNLLEGLSADERSQVIRELFDDLNSTLGTLNRGPLSIQRLTGLPPGDTAGLEKQTILEVLAAKSTSRKVVETLLDYGRLLSEDRFPDSTRLTGTVIIALASAVLAQRHHVAQSEEDVGGWVITLDLLVASDLVPVPLRTWAQDARKALLVACGGDAPVG
jgi:hypothetical protein